jgi:hypothetical protein
MFIELWFDTYQASLIALGLIMPFAILGSETLRSRRAADFTLLALVLACFLIVYPVLFPILVVASGIVLGWRAFAIRTNLNGLRSFAVSIATLVALVVVFDNLDFLHALGYYRKLLDNTVPRPRVSWHLPLNTLPGWLLQTREFWYMPSLGTGGLKHFVLGAVLPLVFIVFVALGVRRHKPALALVALAGICALVAEYSYVSRDACTYCAERDLLPLAPIAVVLLALGLATVLAMPQRWARMLGIAGTVLVVIVVGQRTRVELMRFANRSYFLDSANRSVLSKLPVSSRAVEIEGYGETLSAQAEFSLVYSLADEHARGRVSIVLGSNLNNAISYLDFGVVKVPGPEFHSDYDYVLTRFAGIETDRRTIARSGGIALEERTQVLDITPYAGLEAPLERLDTSGTAWIQPQQPLQLYVVGASSGPVWARLTIHSTVPVSVLPQKGLRVLQRAGTLTACVLATGSAPVRSVSLELTASAIAGTVPPEEFAPPVPLEGITLTAMRAVTGRCTV